jgi:shikimate kinase
MQVIKNNSIVIYLNITAQNALNRLKDDKSRPLIDVENKKEVVEKMIKERDILYRKYADMVVNNDKNDPGQASNEIITWLKVQK